MHQFVAGSHPPHQQNPAQASLVQPAGMPTPARGQQVPPTPQPGSDPHMQAPAEQVSLRLQTLPQRPQLLVSFCVLTQFPVVGQQVLPDGQPVPPPHMQPPAEQVSPVLQAWVQLPQFRVSDERSRQAFVQQVLVTSPVQACSPHLHWPSRQTGPVRVEQRLLQPPQLVVSFWMLTQLLPQQTMDPVQGGVQLETMQDPSEQIVPEAHSLPQEPQLWLS